MSTDGFTVTQNLYIQIAGMVSSSVSFAASSTMVFMIFSRSDGALSTPYRRLILAISISDMFLSVGFFSGPFMIPVDTGTNSILARGNTISCEVNGFITSIGSIAVPLYISSLCVYFLCKIKIGMTNEKFYYYVERWLHACIIIFNITGAILALATDSFNPIGTYNFCNFAGFPFNCDIPLDTGADAEECLRGQNAYKYSFVFTYLPFLGSLIVIIGSMIMISCHAFGERKLYIAGSDETPTRCCTMKCIRLNATEEEHQKEDETAADHAARLHYLYVKETMKLAALYFLTYILLFIFPIAISIWHITTKGSDDSFELLFALFIVYPLGGLFNILVYTRPKVKYVLMNNPEYSYTQVLRAVVLAGGDIPDESALQATQFGKDNQFCRCFCFPFNFNTISQLSGMSDFESPPQRMRLRN